MKMSFSALHMTGTAGQNWFIIKVMLQSINAMWHIMEANITCSLLHHRCIIQFFLNYYYYFSDTRYYQRSWAVKKRDNNDERTIKVIFRNDSSSTVSVCNTSSSPLLIDIICFDLLLITVSLIVLKHIL